MNREEYQEDYQELGENPISKGQGTNGQSEKSEGQASSKKNSGITSSLI